MTHHSAARRRPSLSLLPAPLALPLAVLVLGLGLAACGGGGTRLIGTGTSTGTSTGTGTTTTTGTGTGTGTGTSTTGTSDTSPGGLYAGTLTSAAQGGSFNLVGAVSEGGATQLVNTTNNQQYSMNLGLSGTTATGTLYAYNYDGRYLTSGSFSGTVTPRSQISGSYSLASGDSGSITLNYSSQYASVEPVATAAGSYLWTSSRNGGASTLTLNTDGTLSGATETGCSFSGTAAVANASYDLFFTTLNYASSTACGAAAGSQLNGLAWYVPTTGAGTAGLASVANSSQVGLFAFYQRQ